MYKSKADGWALVAKFIGASNYLGSDSVTAHYEKSSTKGLN